MDKSALRRTVAQVAKPRAYKSKEGLFWKRHGELTTIIGLQRSQWGSGTCVNVGVTPNELVTRATPPGIGLWPMSDRASNLQSQYQEVFRRLELDDDDRMDPEELRSPFDWLLCWLDSNYGVTETMKQKVADAMATHPSGDPGPWILADWAAGKLREAKHYYPYWTRYYG